MIKLRYEAPQCLEVGLRMEGTILTMSVLVTLSLIDSQADTDTRNMVINSGEDW